MANQNAARHRMDLFGDIRASRGQQIRLHKRTQGAVFRSKGALGDEDRAYKVLRTEDHHFTILTTHMSQQVKFISCVICY